MAGKEGRNGNAGGREEGGRSLKNNPQIHPERNKPICLDRRVSVRIERLRSVCFPVLFLPNHLRRMWDEHTVYEKTEESYFSSAVPVSVF